jgi:hypothetical protein
MQLGRDVAGRKYWQTGSQPVAVTGGGRVQLLGRDVGTDRAPMGAHGPLHLRHLHRTALSLRRLIRVGSLACSWLTTVSSAVKDALSPGWLAERFLTAVRATAAGFVYHQGAVWGAAVAPLLTYFAANQQMGFAKPMIYGTVASSIVYVIAACLGPETKGKVLTANLEVIAPAV